MRSQNRQTGRGTERSISRGMTMVEAVVSIALSAVLAIAVAQTVAVAARTRVAAQQHADAWLAASNALETLRAADASSLEQMAEQLSGPIEGTTAARLEITLRDTRIGDNEAREIILKIVERPDASPLVLAGWHLAAEEDTDEP